MKKKTNKVKVCIHLLILVFFAVIILATSYLKIFFGNETIDEFVFYLTNGATDGDMGLYYIAIAMCVPFFILLMIILIGLFYNILIDKKIILKYKKKSFKIYPIELTRNHKVLGTIVLGIITIIVSIYNLNLLNYYQNVMLKSSFIEENYVMNIDSIKFSEKRNLIYIYVESLETTMFTKDQGGSWEYEVIPELYDLLQDEDAISFSANESNGGMSVQYGASWTTAAVVSNSTGLPFKVPIQGNSYHSDNFMNGAYAIGDLLKDHGYYNELISGARTNFGGIKEFFTRHGSYKIIDSNSVNDYGFDMDDEDEGPWGFNDKYLFEVARDRLEYLSNLSKPFNMTIMTIDTHPNDGYMGDYSTHDYDTQYDNVYKTDSELISEFVHWVKNQDFYQNTTIVIVGDHLNMQTEYFKGRDKKRYIYNVIINPVVKPYNTKNRIFTSVDMYPTTIAAIGGIIEGQQLGLGTNLFSNKKTLAEKYGLEEFNANLEKRSPFYNTFILGSDFFELVAKTGNEEDRDA